VDPDAVEAVGSQRAMRTSRPVVRVKHEVIHNELTAPREQISERFVPVLAVEDVFLRHALSRQAPLQPAHFVALASKGLLFLQERSPCREPFLMGYHRVTGCRIVVGSHGEVLRSSVQPDNDHGEDVC
jgi:hypothetical protein